MPSSILAAMSTLPRRAWAFHATVFIGAFLLFQMQPMLTKALLPGFGGSYLVWGAAMVFFQGVLLLGYAFAHEVQKRLGPVRYSRIHPLLLLLPLFWLPFRFDILATDTGATLPLVLDVVRLLMITAGLPFFALSMTAVMVQRWFSVHPRFHTHSPYVLYSASNLGSLLALLSYPVLVEPFFTLQQQAFYWTAAYIVLVVLHLLCLPAPYKTAAQLAGSVDGQPETAGPKAPRQQILSWFLLSTASCSLLLAVTNVLTFDVAAVPFLWVMPLAIYLGTFVLAFRPTPWFPGWMRQALLWAIPIGILLDMMTTFRITPQLLPALLLHLGILFVVCLNTHVALVRIKPWHTNQLTAFYLVIALGGFCGGMLVSWVAPLLTTRLTEYPAALLLCVAALALAERDVRRKIPADATLSQWRRWVRAAGPAVAALVAVVSLPWLWRQLGYFDGHAAWIATALPVLLILRWSGRHTGRLALALTGILAASFWVDAMSSGERTVLRFRNYYGIYRVFDVDGQRFLQHGTTLHGRQYLSPPESRIPISYFHFTTPIGGLMSDSTRNFKNIGMTGLGTGALAAYAHEGQSFTIFEIDADNIWIAEKYFGYLQQARQQGADLQLHVGDGRLLMHEQPDDFFDLLILDAFSSGSIPIHLITVEAFQEYFRVLRPDGLIMLQISNRMLNLEPLMFSIARHLGVGAASADNAGHTNPHADLSHWVAMFEEQQPPALPSPWREYLRLNGWRLDTDVRDPLPPAWSDRYSNLLRLIR